ncbi:TetR/AcrR family transcriptional regulator [Prauserella alba]|uniref:TetR/AcrR family transcriptional regulator n=1 Tax=Prauserella alba TaxID=176898 RepID=UPI0020A5B93F|nr:TetR/AcrR family transcriptional regulator [Prauserella alba]MCP2180006.1 transcriptional regulator, TetR family [Prauserella alba]
MTSTTPGNSRRRTHRKRAYAPRLPLAERREHLLDAALRVLAREGYDRISIEAIAKEAGVTRPVVYGAFDGLEPLLNHLLDRTQRRALDAVARFMPENPDLSDPDGFLLELVAGVIDAVRAEPEVWGPVLGLIQGAPAVVRDRIEGDRRAIRARFEHLLAVGLEIRGGPDLDVELLSHMIFVSVEHFGRLVLEEPERFTRERLVDGLAGLLAAVQPGPAPDGAAAGGDR